jgi:ribonuclease R
MAKNVFRGVTIDGEHSKDLDDAIWVERSADGWTVSISIALVADKVVKGSLIDLDARERGTTLYAATRATRPMLPLELSEDELTLTPGGDRDVVGFVIRLDNDLAVLSLDLTRGVLDHKGRFSHAQAGAIIADRHHPQHDMISAAWTLATALLEQRRRGGAIAYFSAGTGMMTDEEGNLVKVGEGRDVSRAYVIVQELMILTNRVTAEYFATKGVQLLFRNHRGNPVADRHALMDDLDLASNGGPLSQSAGNRLRMMIGRASLSSKAIGHFGLNVPVYGWFTSPIRRYADLVNQRIMLSVMEGNDPPYDADELAALGEGLNGTAAREADERSARFKQAAAARTERHRVRGQFGSLDADEMAALIKSSVGAGVLGDELANELANRIDTERLTAKDMGRILFASGDGVERTRAALMGKIESMPHIAVSILNYLEQDGWVETVTWKEGHDATGFRTNASVTLKSKVHDAQGAAPNRKTAKQRSAVALIARLAEIPWTPPASWGDRKAGIAPGATLADDPNMKGALIALCRERGLATPNFSVERAGPPHAPTFACVASVAAKSGAISTKKIEAGSKKEAERLASTELLALLSTPGGNTIKTTVAKTAKFSPESGNGAHGNPKTMLQEHCQKRGWPLPIYDVTQAGSPHAPKFKAVSRVRSPDGDVTSDAFEATSRKDAEKLAAAALLSRFRLPG